MAPRLFDGLRSRLGVVGTLGTLEGSVLEVVWGASGPVTVRDVQSALQEPLAYTTLMTTLDRLYKKGYLRREKVGRAFCYGPRVSREQLEQGLASGVIGALLRKGEPRPILSCIVESVGDHDHALLDELERLVREERLRRGGGR